MGSYLPWTILLSYVGVLLFIDFFIFNRKGNSPSTNSAIFETIFFIVNALAFSGVIYWLYSQGLIANVNNLSPVNNVVKYLTGYVIELSLSVDNLFVIAMIFLGYKIPKEHQHRLLFLGILGAIVFRAILISLGLILIDKVHNITIVFGIFLLYTAFNMLREGDSDSKFDENRGVARFFNISNRLDKGNFTTYENGRRVFTALFGALITIEFTDLLFALDSIPAIFAVSTDPFIVFSSNIFAIMGLRSLYFFWLTCLKNLSISSIAYFLY